MYPRDPEEYMKRRRMVRLLMSFVLFVQVCVLLAYYFKEKQVALSFPMIVGIMLNGLGLWHLSQLKP